MAEYLCSTTSSTRRKGIIVEAKFPKTSQVAQYDRAREGLVKFLTDGTRSFKHLADAADHLAKRGASPGATEWIQRDSRYSVEAIDAFQRSYNKLGFRKLDCRPVIGRFPLLEIGPTKISVSLDFTVHKPVSGQKDEVGGALLLFSRGESSSKNRVERSKIIAGLIYTACLRHIPHAGEIEPSLCLAVDVFGAQAYTPPGTFAKKLRNVQDACDEIAGGWPRAAPPADYDGPNPD